MSIYQRIKKTAFVLVLAVCMIAVWSLNGVVIAAESNVQVEVKGKLIDFPDQKPFIESSTYRTYVPIRFVADALGSNTDWDGVNKVVSINTRDNDVISLKIGSKTPLLNGAEMGKTLDAPAKLKNGRTLVPLRFISESLGYHVIWDGLNSTVRISDKPFKAMQGVSLGKNYKTTENEFYWVYPDGTTAHGTVFVHNPNLVNKPGNYYDWYGPYEKSVSIYAMPAGHYIWEGNNGECVYLPPEDSYIAKDSDGVELLVRMNRPDSTKPFPEICAPDKEDKDRLMKYPYLQGKNAQIIRGDGYHFQVPFVECAKRYKELNGKDAAILYHKYIKEQKLIEDNQKIFFDNDLIYGYMPYEEENKDKFFTITRAVLQTRQPNGEVYEQDIEFTIGGHYEKDYKNKTWDFLIHMDIYPLSKNIRVE